MNSIETKICNLYSQKKKISEIAKEFKCRPGKISQILKRLGIRIRTAKDVDFLKYSLNHDYFEEINRPEKAYLLGIMFSDGCVSKTNNTISLVSNDIELIEHFKSCIDCSKTIYRNPKHDKAHTLCFCSPKMKTDLISSGCIPRKSLVLKFPKIRVDLYRHFVRGSFDGDGCITGKEQKQAYFLGTMEFLKGLELKLKEFGVDCNKIQRNGRIFRLRITGKDNLIQLRDYLYGDGGFSLKRKRAKFYGTLYLSKP